MVELHLNYRCKLCVILSFLIVTFKYFKTGEINFIMYFIQHRIYEILSFQYVIKM